MFYIFKTHWVNKIILIYKLMFFSNLKIKINLFHHSDLILDALELNTMEAKLEIIKENFHLRLF